MHLFGKRTLIVAAHPDDEAIGCGGTIARLVDSGSLVKVIFLADGELARESAQNKGEMQSRIASRQISANRALEILGVRDVVFLNFPDNRLDTVPLIEIVQEIELEISRFKPDSVLTHSNSDLNVDHSVALRAVLTATRPKFDHNVRLVASFEIPSSSNLGFGSRASFNPNLFVDISKYILLRSSALQQYDAEIPETNHARSRKALDRRVRCWGDFCGSEASEAFELHRVLL